MLHSIVGWGSTVGRWARVEGTPNDPNPNDPRARMDSESLFKDGKLLPAITILGTAPGDIEGWENLLHMGTHSLLGAQVPVGGWVCVIWYIDPAPPVGGTLGEAPSAGSPAPPGPPQVSWSLSTLQAAVSGSLPRCSS